MLSLSYPALPWDCEDCSPTISPRSLLPPASLQRVASTMDGVYEHAPYDGSFMFTSESVGEGHPGELEDSVSMQLLHITNEW